jgi:hypothetical protein
LKKDGEIKDHMYPKNKLYNSDRIIKFVCIVNIEVNQ